MADINTWTGERLETFIQNENTVEHLHRYAMVLDIVYGKIVLDIASGEGYGSNLLSKHAKKVYGVDIDEKSVNDASKKYTAPNVEFRVGSADAIPLENNCIDVVISFETLEHHDKHHEMMQEIKRVLKDDGTLIISTPDKKFYSDLRNYNNPFHVKELYSHEFKDLIQLYFIHSQFYFQNMFRGSIIIPEKNSLQFKYFNGDYSGIDTAFDISKMYIIAIASNQVINAANFLSVFDGNKIEQLQRELLVNKVRKETIDSLLPYKIYRFLRKFFHA